MAGRIVWIRDDDELRAGRDRGANFLRVRLPSCLFLQLEWPDLRAEVLCQSPGLHVVRHHHRDRVARPEEPPAGDEIRFRAAGRDEHLIGRCAGVERGDALAQMVGPIGLAVAESHVEQRHRRGAGEAKQLLDRERMDSGLGEIEAHPVFPGALPALQLEGDKAHACIRSPLSVVRQLGQVRGTLEPVVGGEVGEVVPVEGSPEDGGGLHAGGAAAF